MFPQKPLGGKHWNKRVESNSCLSNENREAVAAGAMQGTAGTKCCESFVDVEGEGEQTGSTEG